MNAYRLKNLEVSFAVTWVTWRNWQGWEICDFGARAWGFGLFWVLRLRPGADRAMFSGLLINFSRWVQRSRAAELESKLKPITFLWSKWGIYWINNRFLGFFGGILTNRQAHGVKSGASNFVVWEVVNLILPQSKASSSLGQHECDFWSGSRPGRPAIIKQHRNPRVDQTPILLFNPFIQIGQWRAHKNLFGKIISKSNLNKKSRIAIWNRNCIVIKINLKSRSNQKARRRKVGSSFITTKAIFVLEFEFLSCWWREFPEMMIFPIF
jgi:hypothetical protein